MARRLWAFFDGEPFLDNPQLIVNPKQKKKGSSMRKLRRRRRQMKTNYYAVNRPKRRIRRRRTVSRIVGNPHRHRRHHHRKAVRRYRRNPAFLSTGNVLGIPFNDVLKAGVAVVAYPIVRKQIASFLPVSLTQGSTGRYVVNVSSALAVGFVASKVLGPEAKRLALIAIGAQLVSDMVSDFFPSIAGMGFYPGPGTGSAGLGSFVTSGGRQSAFGPSLTGINPAEDMSYPSAFALSSRGRLLR